MDGTPPVAYGILGFCGQFPKGFFMSVWPKDGIISKTSLPMFFFCDRTFHHPFKNKALLLEVQMDDGFEMGRSVILFFQFGQQFGHVVPCIFLFPGIAGRVYPRLATKGIHQKSRIVRKTVKTIGLGHKIRLDLGIFLQSLPSFRDFI